MPQLNIYLEGGPDGLAEHALPLAPTAEIKIPYRGGYEHFIPTPRFRNTAIGRARVFEWTYRTISPNGS
jgi:hypothetical protein